MHPGLTRQTQQLRLIHQLHYISIQTICEDHQHLARTHAHEHTHKNAQLLAQQVTLANQMRINQLVAQRGELLQHYTHQPLAALGIKPGTFIITFE